MKIIQTENIAPITLLPGDSIKVTYHEWDGSSTELVEHVLDTSRIVDRVAIVELEPHEAEELGMEDGIAGVFGRRP